MSDMNDHFVELLYMGWRVYVYKEQLYILIWATKSNKVKEI